MAIDNYGDDREAEIRRLINEKSKIEEKLKKENLEPDEESKLSCAKSAIARGILRLDKAYF